MTKTHDAQQHEERPGCGRLQPELEAELLDLIMGGEPGADLAAHLATCPVCSAEVDELQAMALLMSEDRHETHPGEHFFTSLHDGVMEGLGEQLHEGEELVLEGGAPGHVGASGPAQVRDPWGWLEPIRAWFTLKPTLAMGTLVAAAIALLIFWPSGQEPGDGLDYEPSRVVMPSVALTDVEKAELKSLAASIEVDLEDEEAVGAAWSDDDEDSAGVVSDLEADTLWGEGVTGSVKGLSKQELDMVLAELSTSL